MTTAFDNNPFFILDEAFPDDVLRKENKSIKSLKEQTITNNFMFAEVMLDGNNCKDVIELILGRKISRIRITNEKVLRYNPAYKGTRLDIFAVGEDKTVYNIEMQVAAESTERRSRYYHSHMDMNIMRSTDDYKDLPESYVIFICDYDPLGYNKYVYTINNRCREVPEHEYDDGSHTIFLSTKGTNDSEVPAEIVKFLSYIKANLKDSDNNFDSALVSRLQESVTKIKNSREMEDKYMLFEEMMRKNYKDGKAEGRAEGLAEGLEAGKRQASINNALMLIRLGKNTTEDIVKVTNLTADEVEALRAGKAIT